MATLKNETQGYHDRDAAVLRITCEGDLPSVSVGFDWHGISTPRKLNPHTDGGKRFGQIIISAGAFADGSMTNRESYRRQTWWRLDPEYRWAFHPDPQTFAGELRGNDSLRLSAYEARIANGANGNLPLGGIDTVLDRLPCVR